MSENLLKTGFDVDHHKWYKQGDTELLKLLNILLIKNDFWVRWNYLIQFEISNNGRLFDSIQNKQEPKLSLG